MPPNKNHNSQPLALLGLLTGSLVTHWTLGIQVLVVGVRIVQMIV